jgi:hypothetical protein
MRCRRSTADGSDLFLPLRTERAHRTSPVECRRARPLGTGASSGSRADALDHQHISPVLARTHGRSGPLLCATTPSFNAGTHGADVVRREKGQVVSDPCAIME